MDTKDPMTNALIRRVIRVERMLAGLAKHTAIQTVEALKAYTRTDVTDQDVEKFLGELQAEAARDEKSADYKRQIAAAKSEKAKAGAAS